MKNEIMKLDYPTAMAIKTQPEADAYFEKLVQASMAKSGKTRQECEAIQRSNLGYFAGYYDAATRRRVERLFGCAHPVFGAIETNGEPSARKALALGIKAGRKVRQ